MVLPVRAVTGRYRVCKVCTEYPYLVTIDTPWGQPMTLDVCREHASDGFAFLSGLLDEPMPVKVVLLTPVPL